MKSIDSALRFTLGFFTPVAVEFVMLCVMLQFYCGPKYLFNMLVTLGLYTYFSKTFANVRRVQIRDKKEVEKKAEFTLNESILNYETVKAFTNEKLEQDRYSKILKKVRRSSMEVQKSLG
jgi:ATP-binding cassette subfamily B protein